MDKWKVFQIKITAKSKIHIGSLKLGMVELTHRYIPGKNLWGVITAIIARYKMKDYSQKLYHEVGEILKQNMCFTYCFPFLIDDVLIPAYLDNGLEYFKVNSKEKLSDYIFENKYIGNYTSTALNYSNFTAEDSTLHEIEYIKPNSQFMGYIFYKENIFKQILDIDWKCLKKLIEEHVGLQGIGGSRSRGFGKVLIEVDEIKEEEIYLYNLKPRQPIFKPYKIKLDDKNPSVEMSEGFYTTLLPIKIEEGKDLSCFKDFKGNIAPIIGKTWSEQRGAGHETDNSGCVILPGSTFNLNANLKMKLNYNGILSLMEG